MTLEEALEYFLEVRSSNLGSDLIAAGREAARRRQEGPEATAVILRAMRDQFGLTYQEIEEATYHAASGARISRATAERLVNRGPSS